MASTRPASNNGNYSEDYIRDFVEIMNRGIPRNNNTVSRWYDKGIADLTRNKYDDAWLDFNNILSLENKSSAWAAKGFILNQKQPPNECTQYYAQYDEALNYLKKAIQLEPNTVNAAWYYNEVGNSLYYKNDLDMALDAKNKSLELNQNLWFTWYDTALVLCAMGRQSQAFLAVNHAIELNKKGNDYQNLNDSLNLSKYIKESGCFPRKSICLPRE
jgi:tetratricopeptide (TPR) repeat protein